MTDVALLSPLAGLVLAAQTLVPALRDWRRGEENVVGVLGHAALGAFAVSVSIAAMSSTPAAIGCALVFGAGAASDTRWARSVLRRLGLRGWRPPELPEPPPESDPAARAGPGDRNGEDAPQ